MARIESRDVPHRWAHGLDDNEELRGSASIFARGDTIYSYGEHFPMARRVNGSLFLVNPERHSVTTTKHQSWTMGAIPSGATRIHIAPGDRSRLWDAIKGGRGGEVAEWFNAEIAKLGREAIKPRIRASTQAAILGSIGRKVGEWQALHRSFGFKCAVGLVRAPADLGEVRANVEREGASVIRKAKRDAAIAAERAAALATAARRLVGPWRRGGRSYGDGANIAHLGYPVFRKDGDSLESSMGARVPMTEAKRIYNMLPRLRKRPGPVPALSVGHYGGLEVTADAIVVGCHRIPWAEVEATAKHCGW